MGMEMVGMTVNHKVLGVGTITQINKSAGIITIAFKNNVHNFPYPSAFEKFLSVEDSDTQKALLAEIKQGSKPRKTELPINSGRTATVVDGGSTLNEKLSVITREFQAATNDDEIMNVFDSLCDMIIADADDKVKQYSGMYKSVLTLLDDMADALQAEELKHFITSFKFLYGGDMSKYFYELEQWIKLQKNELEDFTYEDAYLDILEPFEIFGGEDITANYKKLLDILTRHMPDSTLCAYINYITKADKNNNAESQIEILQQILIKDPTWYVVHTHMGDVYYGQKEWAKAIVCYEMGFSSGELWKTADVYFNIAWCCDKTQQYEKSIEYYKKCLEIMPEMRFANNNIGYMFSRTKNYELALQYFDKSIALGTDGHYPIRNKLRTLITIGQKDGAIAFAAEHPKSFQTKYYKELFEKISTGQAVDEMLEDADETAES